MPTNIHRYQYIYPSESAYQTLRRYANYDKIPQRSLRDLEDRIFEPEEGREQLLMHWGFTIYRTYYGPNSDQQWFKLLKNITNGVEEGLTDLDEDDKEPDKEFDATTKALDQSRLGARSDPATLG
jgi:hypothetical protein